MVNVTIYGSTMDPMGQYLNQPRQNSQHCGRLLVCPHRCSLLTPIACEKLSNVRWFNPSCHITFESQ